MSLQAIYGFDGVGTGVQGATGVAATAPINGMGLNNTRNAALRQITYSPTAPQYNAIGVTGLSQHQVGAAGERRNALIFYRNVPANNITAGARVMLLENFDARTDRSWRTVVGFTYFDPSDRNPGLGYALVSAWRNDSKATLITRRNDNALQVGQVTYPIERNKEYYIEVELFYDRPDTIAASNAISARVYIDGALVATWDKSLGSLGSTQATVGVEFGFADHITNPYPLHIGLADVYVVNGGGEAPYNKPLGPQKVRWVLPTEVTPDAQWTLNGAADAKTAVTDGRDDTSIRSPLGDAQVDMSFNLNLNPGSIVNGIVIYGRGSRELGAARSMLTAISVPGQPDRENTTTFAAAIDDRALVSYLPDRTTDMAVLQGAALNTTSVKLKV